MAHALLRTAKISSAEKFLNGLVIGYFSNGFLWLHLIEGRSMVLV